MMHLELATAEYIGARARQEDLAAAVPLSAGALLVLADGLGGHQSGAEAARIVVEAFGEAGGNGLFDNPATCGQALRETLDRANARIADRVDPAHGHRGMASTVVAAAVASGELSWVSVGDSHLYVWRGERLKKLNEDHSQAGMMVRSGQFRPTDPEVQAAKSVLVSALTGRKLEIVDLSRTAFPLQPGDVLMLASDGLDTLPDDEIESMVGEFRNQGAVRLSTALLERVRSRRVERQDNTTVVVARVLGPDREEPGDVAEHPTAEAPLAEVDGALTGRIAPVETEPARNAEAGCRDVDPPASSAGSRQETNEAEKAFAAATSSQPLPAKPGRSARSLVLVALAGLVATAVAFAAIATLAPAWLHAIAPGFSRRQATSPPSKAEPAITAPVPIRAIRPVIDPVARPPPAADALPREPHSSGSPAAQPVAPGEPQLIEPERPAERPEQPARAP